MITQRFSCFAFALLTGSSLGASVNPLVNPGFDAQTVPVIGNNTGVTVTGWTPTDVTFNNLVRVDGTNYSGGPNTAHSGNNYYDGNIGAATTSFIWQQFQLDVPVHYIDFGAYFSGRELVTPGNYPHDVSVSIWTSNNWNEANRIATASLQLNAGDADTADKDAQWIRAFAEIPYLQAGTYYIRVDLHNSASVDSVFFYAYEAPEPGGALAGLLLGAGLLQRNRRKR
jgi:hypothetical protein